MNNRQRKKLQAKMKFNLPNVPHFTAEKNLHRQKKNGEEF